MLGRSRGGQQGCQVAREQSVTRLEEQQGEGWVAADAVCSWLHGAVAGEGQIQLTNSETPGMAALLRECHQPLEPGERATHRGCRAATTLGRVWVAPRGPAWRPLEPCDPAYQVTVSGTPPLSYSTRAGTALAIAFPKGCRADRNKS